MLNEPEKLAKQLIVVSLSSVVALLLFYSFVPKINVTQIFNDDIYYSWNKLPFLVWVLFSITAGLLVSFSRDILARVTFGTNQAVFPRIFLMVRIGLFIGATIYALIILGLGIFILESLINFIGVLALVFFVIFPDSLNIILRSSIRRENIPRRFAYGAIGKAHDELEYKTVAEVEAKRLLEDIADERGSYQNTDSVVVKVLSGEQGWGKSSFQRMIVESVPQELALYSYISLTEVNDEQDFGKLFSERWKDTLSERYPILTDHAFSPALKDIVRPQNGMLSAVLEFVPSIIESIVFWYEKLVLKIFPESAQKVIFADRDIARVFFFLSEVKERVWVVVIDEIERSPLPEVYRVIEIIERFKALGRNGLPMQIIFLCIVDEKVLRNRVDTTRNPKNGDSVYWELISGFFFSSGIKTINGKIFLPPVPPSIRHQMVRDVVDKLLKKYEFGGWNKEQENLIKELTGITPYISPDGANFHKQKDQLEFAINTIASKSPRIIEKVFARVDEIIASLTRAGDPYNEPFFNLADVILMEYGRIEFLEFPEYISKVTARITEPHWAWKLDDWFPYTVKDNERISIKQGISRVVGSPEENISDQFCHIVDVLCPSHRKVFQRDNSFERELNHVNSLSWPKNMLKYLRLAWKDDPDTYTKFAFYLQKRQEGTLDIQAISPDEFQEFISFISFVREDISIEIYREVCDEALRRLNAGEFPIDLEHYDGSSREEIIVSILRIVSKIAESIVFIDKTKKSDRLEVLAHVYESLVSSELSDAEIYRAINWTLRIDRNEPSRYFVDIIPHWPNGGEKGFKELIQSVMSDCLERYKGDSDIYKHEPLHLVQFALYQSWSKKNEKDEINFIREIASRTLPQHLSAIEHLWQSLISEYRPEWVSFSDISHDVWERHQAMVVYMPLDLLIKQTLENENVSEKIKEQLDFWEHIAQSSDYREYVDKQIEKISVSEEQTVLSYLVLKGYYNYSPRKNII
jgi:hypothetical protein